MEHARLCRHVRNPWTQNDAVCSKYDSWMVIGVHLKYITGAPIALAGASKILRPYPSVLPTCVPLHTGRAVHLNIMVRIIRTIDVSRPAEDIAKDLLNAAKDVGFFYVSGVLSTGLERQ